MPRIASRPPAVVDRQLAGTTYGQKATGNAGAPDHVRQDLDLNHSAIREWNAVRRGVRKDITSADPANRSEPRMRMKMAHRQNVGGLRRAIRSTATDVGRGFETRQILRSGDVPREYRNEARREVDQDLPQFRKKLSLLCQFDRLAGEMRGGSGADKVATTLSGLNQQAFNNVNVNLKDDIFLAKQNKLLSVSKHFPAAGFGKVKSARSRELIRRTVAATLLQHGYAAAKQAKQDLTKHCELSEKLGTNSAFANHVRSKLSEAVDRINTGSLAATVHADLFGEFTGKTEQTNLQAISKGDMNRLLDIPRDSQLADNQRNQVRDALLMTAAKGTLKAARQFKAELADNSPNQQAILANAKLQSLDQAKAHEPHTYYNPFRRTDSFGQDFNLEVGRATYAAKPHYEMKDSSYWGKPLKNVEDDHVVTVDGHGNDRFTKISAILKAPRGITKKQKDDAALTADRLAERLEKDGLPKTHKVLRLHTCFGGGSTLRTNNDNFTPAIQHNDQTAGAFAQRLAMALHNRGYDDIVVGGYPGSVHTGPGYKQVYASSDGSGRLIPADSLCLYYDGQGQRVPNPRNPDKRLTEQQVNQILLNRMQ